ncbi:MAG: methionine adenosyltransferase [Hyphomicrobiales bacterium]|nr:MAG: methionine adenosyltransferase [Hyphomicrobiales bacterium]|tara:strand:+ start:4695 stop:5864 length:1170 start_codon:yes stop_codon:yes gene_type:complete
MLKNPYLFTSESVSEGHPDKIADQLSDRILDKFIHLNPDTRAGIETLVTSNLVLLAGETSLKNFREKVDIEDLVRNCIREIGYEDENFHWEKVEILDKIHGQSADIARGVVESENKTQGAGDQGIMFGYATDETDSYMPASLYYANQILSQISSERKAGNLKELGPDAKSQVTLLYENGYPVSISKILVSNQHNESVNNIHVREILEKVILSTLPKEWLKSDSEIIINPTGRFVIGGPDGDAGLTGRKIIVDTYGGAAPHGGGAFSGKDPSKVDRSAAYIARYIAKNIVHAKISRKCQIQISYAIGLSYPLSLYIKLDDDAKVDTKKLSNAIMKIVDLSPKGIIDHLALKKPIYTKTSCYGHFGRAPSEDGSFSWEKLDLAEKLLSELS